MTDESASGASLDSSEQEKSASEASSKPFLRVVRGDATPEELAALVAVIASMSGGEAPATPRPRSTWAEPSRRMRTTLPHGPGAWRASGMPR